ncbi:CAF17-like 4Fe-4S cluster assembly/insertion protein YgfZ [Methylomagnum sp.]
MSVEWQAFLNRFPGDSNPSADQGVCALPGYGLIKISGEDAETFLQGQTTCDVKALASGHSRQGAFCTPKGRVIANFRLLRSEQGFYLLLAANMAATVRKRLHMYVLRSKVVVEDLSPDWGILGVIGAGFEPELAALGVTLPDEPEAWITGPDHFALRLNDGRGLIAATADTATRLGLGLVEKLAPLSPTLWRLRNIEAGLPEISAAITEEFLPQMLNLDLLGGIGFKKGCYTGQEIVARTHYLGQLKRRMFRLRCQGEAELAPGALIYDISTQAEPKNVGQVVMAAPEASAIQQILAVIGLEYAQSENLRLLRPDGPVVEWLPLPYSLELPQS